MFIKKILECTISRICDIKKDMVTHNATRPKSIYVHLDQLLFDLKYDPSVIEIPVPRYFGEDDRLPIEIPFKEKVAYDDAKKPKGKPKKKKKKKAADDDDDKKKPEPLWLDRKQELINKLMIEQNNYDGPEYEMVADPLAPDIDITTAIRLIQKNDRGRQGRNRLNLIYKAYLKQNIDNELFEKRKLGLIPQQDPDALNNEAIIRIQRRMRGILARKYVDSLRNDEMEFLGMSRKRPNLDDPNYRDPIELAKKTEAERKRVQATNFANYNDAKTMLQEEMEENEGSTMMEDMIKERRDWITDYRKKNLNKIPDDLKGFHERFKVETPEDGEKPEGEEKKKGEKKEAKKDKKEDKGKKGKKGGKKKAVGEDDAAAIARIGPTETVIKFDEFYSDFNDVWATRDESENYKQEHDVELAKTEVKPLLEEQFTKDIDELIKIELENLKALSGMKEKKKKKKGKKGKKKKKGKAKTLKLPGCKWLKEKTEEDMLLELIGANIVKKFPPAQMTDFIGEFNYIHSMLDDVKLDMWDPSLALIRQLCTEYIIFPLGSELVKSRMRENLSNIMFYGPPGTGKTLMVRAIVTATNSVLFDLSPVNTENKFPGKREEERLIAMTFMTAKKYQPSVIYIDEAEKMWPAKKKKGKKGKGGKKSKKSGDPTDPKRFKKPLGKWLKSGAKFLDQNQRISIIACTSYPEEGSKKEFKKFFFK